jgi:hypothetical protein
MDEPFCVLVESDDLLSFGNKSLRLSEAFVVWEPISQVHDVQVPDQLLNIAKSTLVVCPGAWTDALRQQLPLYACGEAAAACRRGQPPVSRPAGGTPQHPLLQVSTIGRP